MKKSILAVILIISAVFCAFGQNSGSIDLLLLLDTSSAMGSSYEKVNDYITGAFLSEFLRIGDTFHLIAFSANPRLDIARRVSERGDIETIIGRMMIQYPVETGNDAGAAVNYVETYISTLPPRPKKIVMVSVGGSDTNNIVSAAKQRLSSKNTTLDFVPVTGGQSLANLPSSGRASPSRQTTPTQSSSPGTASGTSASVTPSAGNTSSTPKTQGTSQTGAQSTTQSTPQTSAQSTTQGTSQTGAKSTTQSTSQTGTQSSTQSTSQTGTQSTTQGTSKTGTQSTTQSASQTGAQSTTQNTPQTNAQSTTQGASQTGAKSTTQSTSQTNAQSTTQGASKTGTQSTTQGASQTGTQSTTQGTSQTGAQSTTPPVQDTSAVSTNAAGAGSSGQGVSPSDADRPASEKNNDFSGTDASTAKAASKKQKDSSASFNPTVLLIMGIIAAILLLTLLLIFASRRLKASPSRVMASASVSNRKKESKITENKTEIKKESKFTDHSKDLASYAATQNKKRVTPYSNKPVKEQVVKQPVINPTDPVLINLFVEDQSTSIGKRNIHSLKSGYRLSVGGGKSDDFLIFLVPMPSNLGEVSRSGSQITFTPHKPKYFPDIGSNEVRDCINKRIRVISEKNYEMWFSFVIYEDPLEALNRVLHSVKVPG